MKHINTNSQAKNKSNQSNQFNQFKNKIKKTRNRIRVYLNEPSVEKIDLSKFFRQEIPKRNFYSAAKKREILIAFEVRDMFRDMSIKTILDEKRESNVLEKDTSNLNKVKVVDCITSVEKTVVVPTAFDIVNDAVLGTFRKGKNFIQHTIQSVEVIPTLDWDHFSYPKINPEY
jgi:hypothetical protein